MKSLVLFYFLLFSVLANCQELKRISTEYNSYGEVYYVLKNNKEIKQGQYLKYFKSIDLHNKIDLHAKTIESYGNYESNKKSGAWIFCNIHHPLNPLISIGEYKDDMKNGQWVYFYSPALKDSNYIASLIRNQKFTSVEIPTKSTDEIKVSLDTTGVKVASIGNYSFGTKTGVWEYYSPKGQLVCKYDYSKNSLLYSNSLNISGELGGIDRFKELIFQAAHEQNVNPFFFKDSKVSIEVSTYRDSINITRLNNIGSESFAKLMVDVIHNVSLDWIDYDPTLEENKIRIYVNYVVEDNKGTAKIDSIVPMIKRF
jgi:antitoxin component YwqK of YwqJK toxin-antitoxin module